MEKAAKEFLEQSGRLYETNKKKWKTLLKDKGLSFNEDIYNDSILKTYEAILKKEVDADYMGYWYTTFFNNTKRQTQYSHTKKKEDIDPFEVLKEKEYEENNINLYYSTISVILSKVKDKFDRKSFEVFRMYLLCNMSYEQLNNLTGLHDSKERITKIRKWLKENMR